MYSSPLIPRLIRATLMSLCMLLLVFALAMLCTGCRTGQKCEIANYGELHYTQTVANSPTTNSKEVPFDILRGFAQGSAVSAAPGATSTQSGSGTFDNGTPATTPKAIIGTRTTTGGDGKTTPGANAPGG